MIAQAAVPDIASTDLNALPAPNPRPKLEVLPAETPRERFERLRDEARLKIQAGKLPAALELLEEALGVARELGDPQLEAQAECNRAAVAITTGQILEHVPRLRTILMRNYGADTSFAAAYNLAQAYESQKEYKKSLFYARIARDRAEAADNQDFLAKSHSQLGLSLLGESYFDQAREHFQTSLQLFGKALGSISVSPRISLGYCMIVLGQERRGMAELYRCLRWLRRRGERLYQSWAHLFLGCGHLELGRLRHAWLHVRRALEIAEETGEDEAIKSALFMLGEVERSGGDTAAAYDCFRRMQERFYPDDEDYAAVLSQVGMAKVVNLRA